MSSTPRARAGATLSDFLAIPEERRFHELIAGSPILLAYPEALLYQLDADGIRQVAYEDTEHYRITRDFLVSHERYFKHMFAAADESEQE
jgi:hypothetical protein